MIGKYIICLCFPFLITGCAIISTKPFEADVIPAFIQSDSETKEITRAMVEQYANEGRYQILESDESYERIL